MSYFCVQVCKYSHSLINNLFLSDPFMFSFFHILSQALIKPVFTYMSANSWAEISPVQETSLSCLLWPLSLSLCSLSSFLLISFPLFYLRFFSLSSLCKQYKLGRRITSGSSTHETSLINHVTYCVQKVFMMLGKCPLWHNLVWKEREADSLTDARLHLNLLWD